MLPGMLAPMLKVMASQLRERIARDGREAVVAGLSESANELLYSLPPEERGLIVSVLCNVELVRHQLGAGQESDAAMARVFDAL